LAYSMRILAILAVCFQMVYCSSPPPMEQKWGISVTALRLTGGDHFVDFRYRVLDPDKAAVILNREEKAILVHEASGREYPVSVNKLGPMRGTTVKPEANRQYVILFSNVNKMLKKGDKVSVLVGDAKIENLTLE